MDSSFMSSEASDSDFSFADSPIKPVKKIVRKPKTTARASSKAGKPAPVSSPLADATNVVTAPAPAAAPAAASAAASKPSANKSSSKKKTVEQIYQKKSQLEHILLRPDSYVGSIESVSQTMWTWDAGVQRIVTRPVSYVPGLLKIFDEIMVNAADNRQRDAAMDRLAVDIDTAAGTIRVENTGRGIPVVMHKEHGCYVPELIFGHLLTSSNYDDGERKVTGGRNGYGAKLANIFSKSFIVETVDTNSGLYYRQRFHSNMTGREEPEVTRAPGGARASDYTAITFEPDLARFGMDELDTDTLGLMYKRVYDMAGILPAGVKVYLNGERIKLNGFKSYCEAVVHDASASGEDAPKLAYLAASDRWQVAVTLSDGQFQQLSFVNGIATIKGGTHVNYIADQIAKHVAAAASKKTKGSTVKPHQVKSHLCVMVNALIENPAFDSQTKETLTTLSKKFGSTCELPTAYLKTVAKGGIVDRVLSWVKFKASAELKRGSGKKSKNIVGIPKLDDANFAGSAKAHRCTLILTEGDSAKSLAVAGLSIVGRDNYGVFPLKGKLLNVREASVAQIKANEEIQNLVKIMGLQFGKTYDTTKSLRYGHLMIMTDQDYDGSHIKGLLLNFIHHFWPSLLRIPGFLQEFVTPIVKVTKSSRAHSFFTVPEYCAWREAHGGAPGWSIKYYKGLGTSSAAEAREYFSDLPTHVLDFTYSGPADDAIDLAFNKKRADDRKDWLLGCTEEVFVDHSASHLSMTDFVHKELILFSRADNVRSLPSAVDGLKPSQRKVLFACFKRNLRSEVKVAQLAGYVSEHSAYHHGEVSLAGTIVGMAQNFVGSNNVNLLVPAGQFGTRLMGGKDAASPRYIFTRLSEAARALFHPDDDALLDYQVEDGQHIEPAWYMPVIPLLLVNGADGIGTGWSSTVPTFNPGDIIANILRMLDGEQPLQMTPWFRGFTGDITAKAPKKGAREGAEPSSYSLSGHAWVEHDEDGDTLLRVTELPVRKWVSDYKAFLEGLMANSDKDAAKTAKGKSKGKGTAKAKTTAEPDTALVKSFRENHTDTKVDFTITLTPAGVEAVRTPSSMRSAFKLGGSVSTTNMHCFDAAGQIVKYKAPTAVLRDFFGMRLRYYEKRKTYKLGVLANEWERLDNKARFISEVLSGELVIAHKKKAVLLAELQERSYKQFTKGGKEEEGLDAAGDSADVAALAKGYAYLLSMPLWSLTQEKVDALRGEVEEKELALAKLRATTPADLWRTDLANLQDVLLNMFPDDTVDGADFVSSAALAPPPTPAPSSALADAGYSAGAAAPSSAASDSSSDSGTDADCVQERASPPRASKARSRGGRAAAAPASPVAVISSDDSDDEMPSLAARLAARMQVSPQPVRAAPAAAKSRSKAAPAKAGQKRSAAAERATARTRKPAAPVVEASPLKRSPVAKRSRGTRKAVAVQPVFELASSDFDSESEAPMSTPPARRAGSRRAAAPRKILQESPMYESDSTVSEFDEDSDEFYDSE